VEDGADGLDLLRVHVVGWLCLHSASVPSGRSEAPGKFLVLREGPTPLHWDDHGTTQLHSYWLHSWLNYNQCLEMRYDMGLIAVRIFLRNL
jgi:hypothetical protein